MSSKYSFHGGDNPIKTQEEDINNWKQVHKTFNQAGQGPVFSKICLKDALEKHIKHFRI